MSGVDRPLTTDVLVVEDDHATRQLLSVALERRHARALVAENGAEAIQLLKMREFCAVVLDLVLPKVDGYGVIQHIKDQGRALPIIVITGLQPDELSAIDRSMVVDVIFKPFDIDSLAEKVMTFCGRGPFS